MSRAAIIRIAVITLIALILVGAILVWKNFLKTPVVIAEQGIAYKVHVGASFSSVTNDLTAQHILKHPWLFTLLVKYRGVKSDLKAGEYLFPKGTTPDSLIDQVITGKGLILHRFSIIAGTTFQQIRDNLNQDPELQHTTKNLTDATIMKLLGRKKLNPEGEFYPDTYYFVADSSDLILLKRAFKMMQKKLNHLWQTRSKNLMLQTPYQALIAASLIEKEAHLDSERPIIAGVMMNRLRKNIILQFDSSVIYGMGTKYVGVVHKSDLINNTPYNTYVNKGLPPTPIAIPSLASLEAATHPDTNDYFYFVATGDHISHHFSKTLAQHNKAVIAAREFQLKFFNSSLIKQYLLKSSPLKPFLRAN